MSTIAERVSYDNYYIDHWSLRLELLTILEVLRFREARGVAPQPAQLPACAG